MLRTGYPGLSQAVNDLGLASKLPIEVDFASSSLGNLNEDFLKTIYTAAQGQQTGEATIRASLKHSTSTDLKNRFRIYFPTHETVASSSGGTNAAGTITLQRQWWSGPKFPKQLMRDYLSSRIGLLSHNKLLLVRGEHLAESEKKQPIAWAYTGSANLSESAWGKVVQDRSKGHPLKINCRNWECGVVFPVMIDSVGEGVPSIDVFRASIDVPFEYPGKEYSGRQPWFFMEQ